MAGVRAGVRVRVRVWVPLLMSRCVGGLDRV